ncbi:hypothetical protein CR162_21530 [Pseudoroseomonas rhizosphaerae]|uniref:Phage late control D family protein n=1 Tax=Teichococcus rhizosphaerae TaxID=1335062 RepID=A0A2C7A780_9PROT|nr:hypothetical protein [Pseudoroseomonas rhizosphaerae]PHK92896.1 hypothetical protein CR162_21530 [Pseudoroseomonas rhizosphaerae]
MAYLNERHAPSILTRPMMRLLVGGEAIYGVDSLSLESNGFAAADAWSATLAMGPDSKELGFWADAGSIDVELQMALAAPGSMESPPWQTMLVGVLDTTELDPDTDTVTIRGRDLTSRLLEASVMESYPNLKASELATKFAGEHGLQARVTASPGAAGQHYEGDRSVQMSSVFSHAMKKWDLLCYLADREGYEVFIEGRTLVYQPRREPDRENTWLVHVAPGRHTRGASGSSMRTPTAINAVGLKLSKNNWLSKTIEVAVRSADIATGKTVIARYSGGAVTSSAKGPKVRKARPEFDADGIRYEDGPSEEEVEVLGGTPARSKMAKTLSPRRMDPDRTYYTFDIAGLTEDEALKIAQQKHKEITDHERVISFTIPGELAMTPRNMVTLEGTGSSFDQTYYIHSIQRSMSSSGFTQRVECRNSSPRTVAGDAAEDVAETTTAPTTGGEPGEVLPLTEEDLKPGPADVEPPPPSEAPTADPGGWDQ